MAVHEMHSMSSPATSTRQGVEKNESTANAHTATILKYRQRTHQRTVKKGDPIVVDD
jgi:hypothetical protein